MSSVTRSPKRPRVLVERVDERRPDDVRVDRLIEEPEHRDQRQSQAGQLPWGQSRECAKRERHDLRPIDRLADHLGVHQRLRERLERLRLWVPDDRPAEIGDRDPQRRGRLGHVQRLRFAPAPQPARVVDLVAARIAVGGVRIEVEDSEADEQLGLGPGVRRSRQCRLATLASRLEQLPRRVAASAPGLASCSPSLTNIRWGLATGCDRRVEDRVAHERELHVPEPEQ